MKLIFYTFTISLQAVSMPAIHVIYTPLILSIASGLRILVICLVVATISGGNSILTCLITLNILILYHSKSQPENLIALSNILSLGI